MPESPRSRSRTACHAAAVGAFVYALFGTSRQISTGPSSALAAVAASAVVTTAVPAEDAPQLVAAVTLMAGVLFVLLAVFKMGWVSRFLSKAVITGFLFGAAIEVVVGELSKLTGTSASGDNSWRKFADWVDTLDGRHSATLVVGLISLTAILVLWFTVPKVPGALALVVGGLVASSLFDLPDRGVVTVGDVPRGLPAPELPGLSTFTDHFPTISIAALALLLIGFSQTASDARMFASRHGYRVDVDQESTAQGLSNIGSGISRGCPCRRVSRPARSTIPPGHAHRWQGSSADRMAVTVSARRGKPPPDHASRARTGSWRRHEAGVEVDCPRAWRGPMTSLRRMATVLATSSSASGIWKRGHRAGCMVSKVCDFARPPEVRRQAERGSAIAALVGGRLARATARQSPRSDDGRSR